MTSPQSGPSRLTWVLLTASICGLAACSDASLSYSCQGEECGGDSTRPTDTGANTDGGGAGDEGLQPDGGPDEGGGGGDTGITDVPVEPGLFGDPCTRNEDCRDGFCIVGLTGDYICTVRCLDSCDAEGYGCQLIEDSGADLVRICYPQIFDLCKPCEEDFECGGLADDCVQVQDGTFCGSDCTLNGTCPEGYDCRTSGESDRQCMPSDNICARCFDRDEDGYGTGEECLGTDCNDLDPTVFENAPELCDFKDNDCDNGIDEDIDTSSDADHCGGCNLPCELPHAVNICVASTCFIQECEAGWYDLDDDEPGCEYECLDEDLGIEDTPDREFLDTDCDGIDGNAEQSIFVSQSTGHPAGTGAFDDPVDTIWRGLELADSAGLAHVLVAQGSYTGRPATGGNFESLRLVDGIGVYGGYSPQNWARSADNLSVIGGNTTAVRAENITVETVLANLTIQSDGGGRLSSGVGGNSIALLGINANGLVILDSVLQAGNGGDGDDGDPGPDGNDGGDGGTGGTGYIDGGGVCSSNPAPTRGTPGTSSCAAGGQGGSAGRSTGGGGSGSAAGSVLGGGGGGGADENWLACPDGNGTAGTAGCTVPPNRAGCTALTTPANGTNGPGGVAVGTVDGNGFWVPSPGGSGARGDNGYGGGGGGGGGGATGNCGSGGGVDVGCCDGYGGAGGGGGGAGCGGTGGVGGKGGGASIALYLIDSAPIVSGTELTARNGGVGGDGGRGGDGGFGGDGGPGGPTDCNGGRGGAGGDGTDGGDGGHGGGGGGGVSFSMFLVDSSDTNFESDNTTLWGTGGTGGASSGNAGARGEAGAIRRVTR